MNGISPYLRTALDTGICEQNRRITLLVNNGQLPEYDRLILSKIKENNEKELKDPVLGKYHQGYHRESVDALLNIDDPHLAKDTACRLAIVACYTGDGLTLNNMRAHGIKISSLRSIHGYAAGFAVDYPACLQEFLKDGMDPSMTWYVDDKKTDLMIRTCELNGRSDIIKILLDNGATCSPTALLKACESGFEDAVYELVKHDPCIRLPEDVTNYHYMNMVDKARLRVCTEQKAEIGILKDSLQRSMNDHQRFINTEMPNLITAATNVFQLELNGLRRQLVYQ